MKTKNKKTDNRETNKTFCYQSNETPKACMENGKPCNKDKTIGNDLLKSDTDPNGSYTGVPLDGDVPVQDADDL